MKSYIYAVLVDWMETAKETNLFEKFGMPKQQTKTVEPDKVLTLVSQYCQFNINLYC